MNTYKLDVIKGNHRFNIYLEAESPRQAVERATDIGPDDEDAVQLKVVGLEEIEKTLDEVHGIE